jgi:hypothetical protein
MANELKIEKKAQAVSLLCEGNSIRSIERISGKLPKRSQCAAQIVPCAAQNPNG